MKKIEVFIDSIYQNVGGNAKSIQELKAEMKSHLLEAVHELKAEGKSEEEAIDIAINRFGGEKEVRSVVGQLFNAQKTFAKWVLYTALAFLLLPVLMFSIVMPIEKNQLDQSNQIASQILNSLGDQEKIPTQLEEEVQEMIKSSERITGIWIYDYEELFSSTDGDVEPRYSFQEKTSYNRWDDMGFVIYNQDGKSNDTWHVNIESKSYEGSVFNSLLVGIIVYWTLFVVWATINTYHHKRLNIGWIFSFVLLNVVGYLIYRIAGRKASAL